MSDYEYNGLKMMSEKTGEQMKRINSSLNISTYWIPLVVPYNQFNGRWEFLPLEGFL